MKKILSFAFLMVLMFALTVSVIAESCDNQLDSHSTTFELVIYRNNDSEMDTKEQECTNIGIIVHDDELSESGSVDETEVIVLDNENEENYENIADNDVICQYDEVDEDEIEQDGNDECLLANGDSHDAIIIVARASVKVNRFSESHSELVIVITHEYLDKTEIIIEETFIINNNAAGRYNVGEYVIYVDIKGDNMIRACYIVR